MKAWQWQAPEKLGLVDLPRPVPEKHEALIRVEAVGVCGSDIHYFLEGAIGENRLTSPVVLGHEYAGIVEEVGAEANPELVGRRVAVEPGIPCRRCEWCVKGRYNLCTSLFFPGGPGSDGAVCEYIAVDHEFCFPLPEGISAGTAAMVEPAAVAVHTAYLAQLRPGDTAAVFGLGIIGLLTARMLQICGASRVYCVDVLPYRVAAAKRYGLQDVFCSEKGSLKEGGARAIDWIQEQTKGRGCDVSFDCTNSADGMGLACGAARRGGRVVLTGISGNEMDLLPVSIARRRELCLQWCRRFVHNYPVTIDYILSGALDVDSLITHVFSFEEAPEAFALTSAYGDDVLKASIEW